MHTLLVVVPLQLNIISIPPGEVMAFKVEVAVEVIAPQSVVVISAQVTSPKSMLSSSMVSFLILSPSMFVMELRSSSMVKPDKVPPQIVPETEILVVEAVKAVVH